MRANKLSDLLPIPDGVPDPHAYQVFGLAGGEEDSGKIKAAVKKVYADLKRAKSDADPEVWKQAAKIAERSKAILSDPAKRAELDAQFANSSSADAAKPAIPASSPTLGTPPTGVAPLGTAPTGTAPANTVPTGTAPVDPLAGMLPSADPLAGMLPNQIPPTAPAGTAPLTTPGQPLGYPQQPIAHQPLQGQPVQGQPFPSQQIPSQQIPGQPAPLPPATGQMLPGQAVPVQHQAHAGQPLAHPGYPGQAYPQHTGAQAYPGPTVPPGTQPYGHAAPNPIPAQPPAPAGPILKVKKKTKRRRKSGLGKAVMFLGVCGIAATIGGLAVMKWTGSNVKVRPDGTLVNGDEPQGDQTIVRRPKRKEKPNDPVMGKMAGKVKPPPPLTPTGIPQNEFSPTLTDDMAIPGLTSDNDMKSVPNMTADQDADANPNMTSMQQPEVNPDSTFAVSPGTQVGPTEMDENAIADSNKQIEKVAKLIASANWAEMKPAAEKVTEMMMTDEQRADADGMYNLADLATFYRGAIVRGLGNLKATQDFDIGDGFRVLVVEVNGESLTIRYNAKNRTYSSLDEMPFSLVDKLATFALSQDKPDAVAAKWAYHAIAPKSNEDHRKESVKQLQMLDGQVPDVDTKAVAKVIEMLF